MKEVLIVGLGSFVGGSLRYLVGKTSSVWFASSMFPLGTFIVNITGCLAIGFLYGLNWTQGIMNENTKLLLTTGLCGGFTTFSTFMNENASLLKDGNYSMLIIYTIGSILAGLIAVIIGHYLAKQL